MGFTTLVAKEGLESPHWRGFPRFGRTRFEREEAPGAVQAWLNDKPSSRYSRTAGHLATWLTGHQFDYLRAHDETVKELESWLDMRQSQLNTLIDDIVQGNGALSKRKLNLAEGLSAEQLARVEACVSEHFAAYIDSRA